MPSSERRSTVAPSTAWRGDGSGGDGGDDYGGVAGGERGERTVGSGHSPAIRDGDLDVDILAPPWV
eukprot:CAMPEP_0119527712 /NCGR_PEP_ID=MMETSP1344-20130328/42058_1 /TAXON_ID=236787 /ORGANISM="Florenciella parvula, Strain CCMP2471" /LENGTH=65 /DNA_ID=CAMNT_0007566947 /DNA_START=9 /DNA_END=204 /DNA_ORIENTATION=-